MGVLSQIVFIGCLFLVLKKSMLFIIDVERYVDSVRQEKRIHQCAVARTYLKNYAEYKLLVQQKKLVPDSAHVLFSDPVKSRVVSLIGQTDNFCVGLGVEVFLYQEDDSLSQINWAYSFRKAG